MAGTLNGIGGQQIPLATTFQPGQARQQPQDDKSLKTDQTRGTQASQAPQAQDAEARSSRDLQSLLKNTEDRGQSDRGRGSVVDITV